MYEIETKINLKSAKGKNIPRDNKIESVMEKKIMPSIKKLIDKFFTENGIEISQNTTIKWVNIKEAEFKEVE